MCEEQDSVRSELGAMEGERARHADNAQPNDNERVHREGLGVRNPREYWGKVHDDRRYTARDIDATKNYSRPVQ